MMKQGRGRKHLVIAQPYMQAKLVFNVFPVIRLNQFVKATCTLKVVLIFR